MNIEKGKNWSKKGTNRSSSQGLPVLLLNRLATARPAVCGMPAKNAKCSWRFQSFPKLENYDLRRWLFGLVQDAVFGHVWPPFLLLGCWPLVWVDFASNPESLQLLSPMSPMRQPDPRFMAGSNRFQQHTTGMSGIKITKPVRPMAHSPLCP